MTKHEIATLVRDMLGSVEGKIKARVAVDDFAMPVGASGLGHEDALEIYWEGVLAVEHGLLKALDAWVASAPTPPAQPAVEVLETYSAAEMVQALINAANWSVQHMRKVAAAAETPETHSAADVVQMLIDAANAWFGGATSDEGGGC